MVYVLVLGLAALFGQYFVTKAYGADKAGIVSLAIPILFILSLLDVIG